MESFFRYIAYIDLYENNTKIRNAGFLRWKYQNSNHFIEVHIKDANNLYGIFKIEEKNTGNIIGNIKLDQGIGSYQRQFPSVFISDRLYLNTENNQIRIEDVQGFYIPLTSCNYLFVPIKLPIETTNKASDISEVTDLTKTESVSENVLIEGITDKYVTTPDTSPIFYPVAETLCLPEESSKKVFDSSENMKILEPLHEDKWLQLSKKYKKLHPFSNADSFLSIKPEDFIIFQKEYQKLVQNSFLLHGYYNYGHLILGKLTEEENSPLYLGVPGVYYDREKQAAQMFGFVGFESTEQPVQAGSYGYYMIEVMI